MVGDSFTLFLKFPKRHPESSPAAGFTNIGRSSIRPALRFGVGYGERSDEVRSSGYQVREERVPWRQFREAFDKSLALGVFPEQLVRSFRVEATACYWQKRQDVLDILFCWTECPMDADVGQERTK